MVKSIIPLALSFAAAIAGVTAATEPHESGGAEHIVIFNRDQEIPSEIEEVLTRLELTSDHPDVHHVFKNSAFRGFAANMKSHCLDLLANMTDISVVEKTASVQSAYAIPRNTIQRRDTTIDTRGHAPWGLNRISTAAFTEHGAREMDYSYNFVNGDLGSGADVYIVDTGVYEDHVVFGGRAKQIWSFDKSNEVTDGHGTHVAGTAAGETLGVASKANIFGVRTLAGDGAEGWSSNVVAGIDFVMQQHEARKSNADFKGSVLSMSLASAGNVDAIDQALDAAIKAGVHVVVAAGNSGEDACTCSPASSGGTRGPAIVVGSVGITGETSSFSNYGTCVDVYAPGEDIISSWIGAPDVVNVLSGTSMATPHVTGIVAYAMANSTLAGNPGLMKEWIRMQALPRGDGTVLVNNGVWSSGDSKTKAVVSPNTIAAVAAKYKRSLATVFTRAADFYGKSAPAATTEQAANPSPSSPDSPIYIPEEIFPRSDNFLTASSAQPLQSRGVKEWFTKNWNKANNGIKNAFGKVKNGAKNAFNKTKETAKGATPSKLGKAIKNKNKNKKPKLSSYWVDRRSVSSDSDGPEAGTGAKLEKRFFRYWAKKIFDKVSDMHCGASWKCAYRESVQAENQ